MSWWHGLDALERWSESHPTPLAIFGAAMRYLSTLGPAAPLRLHHEVSVVPADRRLRVRGLPPRHGLTSSTQ
jgi:aldoxime dehydratase